jgi:type II secretory pathway component PulF
VEILITTLLVPTVGALLLFAEWQSRTAFGRIARKGWRHTLKGAAIALIPLAAGMLWHALSRLATDLLVEQLVPTAARLLLVAVAGCAAYRSWQIGLTGDYYSADRIAVLQQSQARNQLQLCAWILVGFPLLWAAVPALMLVAPLLFAVAVLQMGRRAERTRFLWQMAIAVEHGMDLAEEVDAFASGARSFMRERYVALAGRLRDGTPLSEALATDNLIATPDVVAAVRVAELTGTLPATLMAAAQRNHQALCGPQSEGSIFGLLCYYWVVMVVLAGIVSFLEFFIAPKFYEIFKDFDLELPQLTKSMFELSISSPLFMLLIVPLLAVPAATLMLLTTRAIDGGTSPLWNLTSGVFPRRDSPGVLRWLALAVAGGKPLPPLINDVAERQPQRNLSVRLLRAAQAMESGRSPWESLVHERMLSAREAAAIQAGERAGSAPLALNAIADAMERARLRRVLWWIEWLRPIVMLTFGGLVGTFCVAYFLPLVSMMWKLIETIETR